MRRLLTVSRPRIRIRIRIRSRCRDERGAVAILVALFLAVLLLATAMVLDFGIVRVDRQVNKSAADAATAAGLQGLAGANNKNPFPYHGICNAIDYLQKNSSRFSGVTAATGTWTNGNGASTGNGCTGPLFDQVCTPGSPASWGRFTWNGNYSGEPLSVVIQSGYQLSGSGWAEESLSAVTADNNDQAQGCGQLAVIVTQNRKPGLGSLATSADLVSSIRSVGRVELGPGRDAPAMILLKQTGCPVLETGSNSGESIVHVYGSLSSDGSSAPGSIHADTNGAGCSGGSNQSIFLGKAANGIVAYAAPLASSPLQGDPAKPGLITSFAGTFGITGSVIRDGSTYAYGSDGVNEASGGNPKEPQGRDLVTRKPVDERYLGLGATPFGVNAATSTANGIFTTVTGKTAAQGLSYKIIDGCSATAGEINAISTSDSVYVNCKDNAGYNGTIPIPGQVVVFAGSVKPPSAAGTSVSLPNARRVYIFGDPTKDAVDIGNNSAFKVNNTTTNVSSTTGRCTTTQNSSKTVLVIKAGQFKQTGGLLQLCRTTVIMMGNRTDACLPSSIGTAPTTTPCGGGTGDGQITLSGTATIDWTAPNSLDLTKNAFGTPTAAAIAAWRDPGGPEDLALWSESAGLSSSPTYSMGGSGTMHTVGVFMVPNAGPFGIGGSACQNLFDAQYIATSIKLNGSKTCIKMRVDAQSAVTIPRLRIIGLVR